MEGAKEMPITSKVTRSATKHVTKSQRFPKSVGSLKRRDPAVPSSAATSSTWPPCSVSTFIMVAAMGIQIASKISPLAWSTAVQEKLFLCSAWILWTRGNVQLPYQDITTTQPARCVRSSSTPAVEGAATTLSRGRAAWMCVLKEGKSTPPKEKCVAWEEIEIIASLSGEHRRLWLSRGFSPGQGHSGD